MKTILDLLQDISYYHLKLNELTIELHDLIDKSPFLDRKEKKLFKWRHVQHRTLEEVGKEFGLTRERIRQLEAKIIETLRVKEGQTKNT